MSLKITSARMTVTRIDPMKSAALRKRRYHCDERQPLLFRNARRSPVTDYTQHQGSSEVVDGENEIDTELRIRIRLSRLGAGLIISSLWIKPYNVNGQMKTSRIPPVLKNGNSESHAITMLRSQLADGGGSRRPLRIPRDVRLPAASALVSPHYYTGSTAFDVSGKQHPILPNIYP